MVSSKKSDFVFLIETMVGQDHAERLRIKIGFEGLFYVDNERNGGGLALLWRKNNTATLLSYSKNHVDVEVRLADDRVWRMTGFYGFPKREDRRESWELLGTLSGRSSLPWVMAMRGYQFTWEKSKGTNNWIEERLDKVLATASWGDVNPHAERRRGHRGFRFEMAWLLDEGCREVVETAWHDRRTEGLLNCQQYCGHSLMRWGGDHFHKFGDRIKRIRAKQEAIRHRRDPDALTEFQSLEIQLTQLEAQEDTFWRQRAKQHWLRGANVNTKFYHSDPLFNDFAPRVTPAQNMALLRPFDIDEVRTAVFSMFPDKAPGPDGMNPGFYQHFWDVVGVDVSGFIVNTLNSRILPNGLNDTNIVLIPKKNVPETVGDMRPIALSNVLYRIMAKMITNRMKPLMENLISDSQSAFISGRLITDNILVASEVGHFLNRKQCGNVGWGALKLDMAKAYDRMEWPFLKKMLQVMGFDKGWIDLIMTCVTTVTYQVVVNGVPGGKIIPTRGLRQGDPLSPYLFIICAEGLSLLLQKAELAGSIHGCRVARGAPPVSHFFFADDSLLFFKANLQEASVIKQCLLRYENLSGQMVNYHKSNICFSKNTSREDRDLVANCLGVDQAPNFGKYLGLPSFIGRNKRAVFSYVEDKIKQRIGSWNKKLLSQAGKEVLLKSVAQSMPTFLMSIFLLPDTVCLSIERTMNRYWWGKGVDRGIHWKAWDKLCVPKRYGGLGFKDLRSFNLAMLGKQAWRFLTNPTSLAARIYKARYYPTTSFIDAKIWNCPNYCWRSIMAAHEIVCSGVRRRIGNGGKTLIWGHPWLPDDPSPLIQTVMPEELREARVVGLIDQQTKTWDPHILCDLFEPDDVARISRIPVSPEYEDSWYWYKDPRGEYSVKNAYRQIVGDFVNNSGAFDKWITLWKLKVPPKWKTFLIVWNISGLPVTNIIAATFPEWIMGAMANLTEEQFATLVGVLYHLWNARNEAVWKRALPRPPTTWRRAATARLAYIQAHCPGSVHAAQPPAPALQGRPRCFFDGGFRPQSGDAAYSVVLLHPDGSFKAATNGKLTRCFSPLMAEALACKEALSWLKERNELDVDMLTDCTQLRHHLRSSPTTILSYEGVVEDQCRSQRQDGCGFVELYDPPMCYRSKRIIPGLLKRINRLEEDIRTLNMKIECDKKEAGNVLKKIVGIMILIFVGYIGS
ncbi:PREDICTED: uncharacterized protein LOC109148635 [Ipomoea nil]|uniref:uncharacterized protein LOC109148635 n=1 Tax=Ipomoea nil TaxID=35883 RepID=UPI000901A7EF|nr:PREDICTED: uncharacterized protein LOC109148635 [Ipomoea nil]